MNAFLPVLGMVLSTSTGNGKMTTCKCVPLINLLLWWSKFWAQPPKVLLGNIGCFSIIALESGKWYGDIWKNEKWRSVNEKCFQIINLRSPMLSFISCCLLSCRALIGGGNQPDEAGEKTLNRKNITVCENNPKKCKNITERKVGWKTLKKGKNDWK